MNKRGLGRGLDALLPSTPSDPEQPGASASLREVAVDAIIPNPQQPRSHFDETALDPSIAETALELAAMNGDQPLYERYVSRMTGSTRRDDEVVYRRALTHFTDPALTKRTLDYATSADVRTQDAPDILRQLMARPWAVAPTWAHVKNNWASLEKSLDIFQGLPNVVGATQHFCDPASREDVERFFNLHRVRGTERTLTQALETIDRCIATKSRQSKNLSEFLN